LLHPFFIKEGLVVKTDWHRLFVPEMSLLEGFLRGTLIYLAICLLLRIILKRQAGKVALSDFLVIALIAGVCRNPLVRDAYSIPDGLMIVLVVLGWSYALDWLSYYSPIIHKLLHPEPNLLIRDGQVLKENLRRELMTESQLRCQLRQAGVKEPAQVDEAWMEGSGNVSVLKKEAAPPAGPAPVEAGQPELERLVEVARQLQEAVHWHQVQSAEHAARAATLKDALARAGLRLRAPSGRHSGNAP
jgi:uncharacterized membrane protein YcaP (DUF421 family)